MPGHPAALYLVILFAGAVLSGCLSGSPEPEPTPEPTTSQPAVTAADCRVLPGAFSNDNVTIIEGSGQSVPTLDPPTIHPSTEGPIFEGDSFVVSATTSCPFEGHAMEVGAFFSRSTGSDETEPAKMCPRLPGRLGSIGLGSTVHVPCVIGEEGLWDIRPFATVPDQGTLETILGPLTTVEILERDVPTSGGAADPESAPRCAATHVSSTQSTHGSADTEANQTQEVEGPHRFVAGTSVTLNFNITCRSTPDELEAGLWLVGSEHASRNGNILVIPCGGTPPFNPHDSSISTDCRFDTTEVRGVYNVVSRISSTVGGQIMVDEDSPDPPGARWPDGFCYEKLPPDPPAPIEHLPEIDCEMVVL